VGVAPLGVRVGRAVGSPGTGEGLGDGDGDGDIVAVIQPTASSA
jgi:hypothetical protein